MKICLQKCGRMCYNAGKKGDTKMTDTKMLEALEYPSEKIDAVLDTDAYNEIDDQFAIAYMLRLQDKIDVKEIYAAPFFNDKSTGPEDGMEKSYDEIAKILELCGRTDLIAHTYKGSRTYLPDETKAVESPAARRIIELSAGYEEKKRLYVVAIGAITNVASALLLDKTLADRIVVVWLGGNAIEWPDTREFNMFQDVAAARVVFGSGVPLVQLPCMGVVSAFYTTAPELDKYLKGKNALCDYLAENTVNYMGGREKFWSKPIWDVTAVGWLAGGDKFMKSKIIHAPVPEYDDRYALKQNSHFMRYVYHIERDALLKDMFEKLSE